MQHPSRNPVVIIGAGGFAREAHCWAIHAGIGTLAFYDENATAAKRLQYGRPLVGDFEPYKGCEFLVAVGDPVTRERLYNKALQAGLIQANAFWHPSCIIGEREVLLGPNTIICPNVTLTCDIYIGTSVIINLGSTLGHDCVVGDFCTISPGANISGRVKLGKHVYVGSNAVIKEGVEIGNGVVIGMGAVVTKDVARGTVVGNPARGLEPVVKNA